MSFYGRYSGLFGSAGGGGGGGGNLPSQVLANVEAIGSGDGTVTVAFGTPFVSPPVVVAWLVCTDASPVQLGVLGTDSDENGFEAELSTVTPTANYSLHWIASAVND